ncbi:MAG: hypothetical protein AAF711_05295 [Planctomycetota bacterium]
MDQGNHRPRFSYPLLTCVLLIAAMLMTPALTGCGAITKYKRDKQLQAVAKDWNKTIRASQVMPVYPPTEDLQPGDMFIVTSTLEEQHDAWKKKGYLPLDYHLARIQPEGYADFYQKSFLKGKDKDQVTLPNDWQKPGADELAWGEAPMAYFPSYSFTASSSIGANTAFPVSSVPVGLSLLNSGSATVTVQIDDARTLGVDIVSLYKDVQEWVGKNENLFSPYAQPNPDIEPNYLRVVSRVYLAKGMNIGIQNTSTSSGSGSVGASKPVDLLLDTPTGDNADKQTSIDNYNAALEKLNTSLNQAVAAPGKAADALLPGGTVKVVSASSGSISLNETFDRPVIIGYLAFDMAIGPHGELGPPVPTLAVADRKAKPLVAAGGDVELQRFALLPAAYATIKKKADEGDRVSAELRAQLNGFAQNAIDEIGFEPEDPGDPFEQFTVFCQTINAEGTPRDSATIHRTNKLLSENRSLLRRALLFAAGI